MFVIGLCLVLGYGATVKFRCPFQLIQSISLCLRLSDPVGLAASAAGLRVNDGPHFPRDLMTA